MKHGKRITRRAALVGVTAIAGGAAEPAIPADPILGWIGRHSMLDQETSRLAEAVDSAEIAGLKVYGRRPLTLVRWRGIPVGAVGLDRQREALLADGTLKPETIEREYRKMKARQQARLDAERAWDLRAGVAPLRSQLEESWRNRIECQEILAAMRPATSAGAAAMIQHVLYFCYEDDLQDWCRAALVTVADALGGMGPSAVALAK